VVSVGGNRTARGDDYCVCPIVLWLWLGRGGLTIPRSDALGSVLGEGVGAGPVG
jgi:hypothetical protein